MMEDSLAEDRHSPVPGPRPSLPGPGPDAGHDPVRELLPLLHAVAHRRRPDPELQQPRPRGAARVPAPDAAGPRRPDLRRRRPDPRARSSSRRSCAGSARSRTSRSSGSARGVPVFLPQRIDDELCEMLAKYHPLWINLHFNHPNEITPEVSRAVDKLTRAGLPGRQPERAAGRRERLRPHPAGAGPQARREPDPAVLPVPVRPRRGVRATSGRRSARASRSWRACAATPRATRCPTYVIDAPGGGGKIPVMPNYLISYSRPQGRAPQLRGLHHDLRGARDLPEARPGGLRYCQHERPEPGQSGVLGLLEGERMWIEPKGFEETHTRGNTEAHRLQDPSKWVPFGVGAHRGHGRRAAPRARGGRGPGRPSRQPSLRPRARSRARARASRPASAHGELL